MVTPTGGSPYNQPVNPAQPLQPPGPTKQQIQKLLDELEELLKNSKGHLSKKEYESFQKDIDSLKKEWQEGKIGNNVAELEIALLERRIVQAAAH